MILLIDNYDSFTYNLLHLVKKVTSASLIKVKLNDRVTIPEISALKPEAIILSPGPRRPEHAGICLEIVRTFAMQIPILGVCLGHQCLAYAWLARIIHARQLRHGKTSLIHHRGLGVFQNLPSPFPAMRYHSLAIDRQTLSSDWRIEAWSDDQEIMAIQHRSLPLTGLQFHPESFLTPLGFQLLANFFKHITPVPVDHESIGCDV